VVIRVVDVLDIDVG